jgi:hypothetical protein
MALASGAHVSIGGVDYFLDEGYESITGRRCYVHGARSIFAEQFTPTGSPGSQNLRNDVLRWFITDFDGEGQTVLDGSDPESARLFYRSEGLDFRTPGEVKLNRSSIATTPPIAGAASTTFEGSVDMEDVSGSPPSSTTGTDRIINAANGVITTNINWTPGAGTAEVRYHIYRQSFADGATTINGADFDGFSGQVTDSGTDLLLHAADAAAHSAEFTTASDFSAGTRYRVEFRAHRAARGISQVRFYVWDTTDGWAKREIVDTTVASIVDESEPSDETAALHFTPRATRKYRYGIRYESSTHNENNRLVFDNAKWGKAPNECKAKLIVYNQSASVQVAERTVRFSSTSSAVVGTIVFATAAATNYRFRVERVAGNPKTVVDKIVAKDQSTVTYTLDCIDVGHAGDMRLAGHISTDHVNVWKYDASTDEWSAIGQLDASASTNATVRAMAHSDQLEYLALSDDTVRTINAAGSDAVYASFSGGTHDIVGLAVCQNRLFILDETSGGVDIYTTPLDGSSYVLDTDTTNVAVDNQEMGNKSPDTTLRQRMCSSPTGARFFVNYGDVTCKVYQTNASEEGLVTTEIGDLGSGVKGSAIAYDRGYTWITGQFTAESDQTGRSALWVISPNGVTEFIGYFRRDDPDPRDPAFIVAHQGDLYILQGVYVWRYSLSSGGLFLEYQLDPTSPAQGRALAVTQGRVFACYTDEVWVTGSTSDYRQASVAGGNSLETSVYDFSLPGVTKTLTGIQIITDDMASGTQVAVEYQADQSGTWTFLASLTQRRRGMLRLAEQGEDFSFQTLQLRVTLESTDGTNTPYLRGVVAEAVAADAEEYFDLVLLCEDTDASFHFAGEQYDGGTKASHLWDIYRRAAPVTLVDGYGHKESAVTSEYLVTIADLRDERNALGEGRVVGTFKVLA